MKKIKKQSWTWTKNMNTHSKSNVEKMLENHYVKCYNEITYEAQ